MSQTELSIMMRSRLYLYGAAVTALLAFTGLITGRMEDTIIALLLSILLAINSFLQKSRNDSTKQHPITHITAVFLAVTTLLSTTSSLYSVTPWSYIFPMLLFFFYPLKAAAAAVSLYSICFIILLNTFDAGPVKVELLVNYLLCLLLTCGFVYLREVKDRQLKPLRRTDNLTQASTREHLNNDLEKEIQRSEREGADLTVMALALDERGFGQVDSADHDILLNKLGHTLHENLREFDSYYRWQDHEFLLVLPYTNTKQAMKTAEKLRVRAKNSLSDQHRSITVSIGAASLNVGDTASSMLEKSLTALRQAQKGGANRTQSLVDFAMNDNQP